MTASFYNHAGSMVGSDFHKYISVSAPIPIYPHLTAATFDDPAFFADKLVPTVTMDGFFAHQGGYDIYMVAHVPAPLVPPNPELELAVLGLIVMLSGTTAKLKAHSVTGGGSALACCIEGAFGLNVNCNDPADLPSGVVNNVNSVVTTPTAGDFAGAFAAYLTDATIGWMLSQALSSKEASELVQFIVKNIVRRLPDWFPSLDFSGAWQDQVEKWVDE